MLTRLTERRVLKPWGRDDLPPPFGPTPTGERLGEIWFEREGRDDPLLVKYLFTSERLSIQVHPDDESARKAGHARGKDEAWVVLDARPDAEIGIGLKSPVSPDEIREAALDGTIEQLLDWRPVSADDAYYSPAGTVHSIGAGLTLIEVQQNSDVTYRLHDFSRGRELHVDAGVEAAKVDISVGRFAERQLGPGRSIIAQGRKFTLERWSGGSPGKLPLDDRTLAWLIPIRGPVAVNGCLLESPGVWIAEGPETLEIESGGELLLAYQGEQVPISPSALKVH